jgi:hypothetical protein
VTPRLLEWRIIEFTTVFVHSNMMDVPASSTQGGRLGKDNGQVHPNKAQHTEQYLEGPYRFVPWLVHAPAPRSLCLLCLLCLRYPASERAMKLQRNRVLLTPAFAALL